MAALMGGGLAAAPDPMPQLWKDVLTFVALLWALGGMLLRLWTDTPAGKQALLALETKFGISDSQMQALLNTIAPIHANLAQILDQAKAVLGAGQVALADARATSAATAAIAGAQQPPAPAGGATTLSATVTSTPASTESTTLLVNGVPITNASVDALKQGA